MLCVKTAQVWGAFVNMDLYVFNCVVCIKSCISTSTVGFYASNNTCVACPLGTYAASQNGGGVSLVLACQVNKERVTVMVKFMHSDLYVIWFSNFIIYCVKFRLVQLVHTPL